MAFGNSKSLKSALGAAPVSTRPGNRGPRGPEEHPRTSTKLAAKLAEPAATPTAAAQPTKKRRIQDVMG